MNGIHQGFLVSFLAFSMIACGPAELRPELDDDNTGNTAVDNDGDGYYTVEDGPADCNDSNKNAYPGAKELCDGVDNDCDGDTDEGCTGSTADTDGDGYLPPLDCDNLNANVHPGKQEVCGDSLDNNCDGQVNEGCQGNTGNTAVDNDGDGYFTIGGQIDCNDGDANVKPGAPELCGNNRDDDCDGDIDEGCSGNGGGNTGGGTGNSSDLWVEVCYPGAPNSLQLNVQYYGNGNDVGKYWQKSGTATNSSCVSITVPKADLPSNVCGVRLNVTKDSYSWLCEGNGSTAHLDGNVTSIQVNHAGKQYSKANVGTWSAPGGANSGCSALVTFSTSGVCAL